MPHPLHLLGFARVRRRGSGRGQLERVRERIRRDGNCHTVKLFSPGGETPTRTRILIFDPTEKTTMKWLAWVYGLRGPKE
jgi:hypothetical protein